MHLGLCKYSSAFIGLNLKIYEILQKEYGSNEMFSSVHKILGQELCTFVWRRQGVTFTDGIMTEWDKVTEKIGSQSLWIVLLFSVTQGQNQYEAVACTDQSGTT